ncbi:ATP-binding protein [Mesobacillus subterraneus]|uniref:ATP-binding protein n=1 Tax=Mesobacillus subterraneus TaxID=285983 RepID=UPI002040A395|nr:ATP-binding protein [Mesobacillus subterraneus]MCM3576402.1 ATP-binding protein [Mesobacillus subterraneus]
MKMIIGRIIEVTANKISCELVNNCVPFNFQGEVYDLESVGSLLSIYDKYKRYTLIYQVTKIYEKEQIYLKNETSKSKNIIALDAIPLAEISSQGIDFGVNRFPMVGEPITLSEIEEVKLIYSHNQTGVIIGEVNSNFNIKPRFNNKKLFSSHVSIFGNTNSGKSTTIAKILKETLQIEPEFNSLVFDVHDEYEIEGALKISIDDISIDPCYVSIEDWVNLINPSSLVQLPILINGIKLAHNLKDKIPEELAAFIGYSAFNSNIETASTKLIFVKKYAGYINNEKVQAALKDFTLSYGNFSKADLLMEGLSERFIELTSTSIHDGESLIIDTYLNNNDPVVTMETIKDGINIALTLEESRGNLQVRSHCQTMMTRIDLLLSHFKRFFEDNTHKRQTFDDLINNVGTKIINVSSLDDDLLKFITHLILRITFLKQKSNKQAKQINFIFDEAHKYIRKNQVTDDLVRNIFDTIAREGRKFKLFLCICSQQPHELSSTVVSQCGNFILHRLKNNLDLEFIKKSNPYITENQISRLSSLPTGTALILGDAIPIPIELKIEKK